MSAQVTYLQRAAQARRNVPKMIRLLLVLTGRPANDLAKALVMSSGRLSERLTGKTRISSEELAVCAEFFGVDAGVFYRDPETFRRQIVADATVSGEEGRLLSSEGDLDPELHEVAAA